ncbi:MAG: hypothetical protein P9L94_19400 [Candidatus Hinthialibacter antarcticus]|nr:hypothetical protein [Candidatus Hinthialibacter antarcticus]
MNVKPFVSTLVFVILVCSAQAGLAQPGVSDATSAKHSQSSDVGKLRSDDSSQYAFDDNLGALMVTLVFFGLFAIFYIVIRNKPSEGELKKIRKKRKL